MIAEGERAIDQRTDRLDHLLVIPGPRRGIVPLVQEPTHGFLRLIEEMAGPGVGHHLTDVVREHLLSMGEVQVRVRTAEDGPRCDDFRLEGMTNRGRLQRPPGVRNPPTARIDRVMRPGAGSVPDGREMGPRPARTFGPPDEITYLLPGMTDMQEVPRQIHSLLRH